MNIKFVKKALLFILVVVFVRGTAGRPDRSVTA